MEQNDKNMSREMLTWALESRDPQDLPWPSDANGEPEEPVWLENQRGSQLDFDLEAAMLRSFGIPIVRGYPQSGRFMRVVLGYTGGGMDIYVPKSLIEDARQLIAGGGELVEEAEQ